MKYVIRKGMFETNSSSTHEMILAVDGKDESGKEAAFVKDIYDEVAESSERVIKSKARKALILYQFKYDHDVASGYGDLKYYFEGIEPYQSFFDLSIELEELSHALRDVYFFKSALMEAVPELEESSFQAIEKAAPGRMEACQDCFWNDVLDGCHCGVDYEVICKRFGINPKNPDDEKRLIKLFLKDNVTLLIKEIWMGGYTCDIPDEL